MVFFAEREKVFGLLILFELNAKFNYLLYFI